MSQQIPLTGNTHRDTPRLKHVLSGLISGGTPDTNNDEYWADGDDGIAWVAIGDMSASALVTTTEKRITESGVASKRLRIMPPGTLIYSMYASMGHVAELAIPATINQALLGFEFGDHVAPAFVKWWLRHLQPLLMAEASSNTQDNLNADKVRNLPFPALDIQAQTCIAKYLDRETARIDRLIAEKERMLALLEEKRAALISRVVTRGLDPNAPLKPSGLDWLGEIPAHWRLWRLKHLGRVESGSGFPHDYQGNEGSELLFLKVSDMNLPGNEYRISASNNTVSREVARELSATVLPSGAVVYAKIGAALLLNKRRILQREACIDNNMSGFVPSRVTSEWAHAWLSILDFGEFVNPGAIPSFTEGQQKDLPMAVPPVEEQQAITRHIEHATEKTSTLTAEIARSINLLRERRAALITAAVTGQIPLEEMTG